MRRNNAGNHPATDYTTRRTRNSRVRYEPTAVYALAERLKQRGVRLWIFEGPWRAAKRPLDRPGRNKLDAIPVVTNGRAEVMVDTMEHAVDMSGFLNWAGVDDLDPVPDLAPPETEPRGA
jgi:hypothetical protein